MIIALTGGIASGKSTVAQTLAKLGAYVIDADKLGHHAYLAGSAAFDQVVATLARMSSALMEKLIDALWVARCLAIRKP